jgi:voltage-gated potassium channel|tara:strand:+ start:98 stop:796 length:699 start_codon:yes stop_codon:yes gene_type:complete
MVAIKQIIERSDTKAGKIFDLFIQVMILISLVCFSIETIPDISDVTRDVLKKIEVTTITLFTLEYIARILVASKKTDFIFSFFGIIDFLTIVPFYLSTGLDLRSLRIFRLFRLVHVLKFARYSNAARRFHRAFVIAKEELTLFFFSALMIIYLAGAGIYFFENPVQPDVFSSIFSSLWWAVATLTTVGYGDIYPITAGGKLFTFFILMIGLGVISMPAGIMASALSKAREMD